jgi:hypothetical protein
MRKILGISAALVGLAATASARAPLPGDTPAIVQGLLACRSIGDAAQRLACYDRQSGAVAQAIDKRDLVLIDKARATQAKRSLFGFSVPDFAGLLGGGDVTQIEGTVEGVSQNADGGLVIRLADGSVWSQTDDTPVALEPRRGDKIVVKRGTLGSYFVKVGSQPGFKAKRIG